MKRIEPVGVVAHTLVCAAGVGRDALLQALVDGRSALTRSDELERGTWCGRVQALDAVPVAWAAWDSRATRLASVTAIAP